MGNILLEDEGLGVRALEALGQRYEIPDSVELLDGGTTGMGLLDDISGRECGDSPSTVTVLGLVPESLEMSLELSPLIQSRLDELVDAAAAEIAAKNQPMAAKNVLTGTA
jgi:Ni,Fe-hydrogenase maturation factor